MSNEKGFKPVSARALVAGVGGALSLLILAPPILASLGFDSVSIGLYLLFSGICHQAPDRVFIVADWPFAVCHRCTGIYWGFFLGAFLRIPQVFRSPTLRRTWILAALFPLAFDALAPYCGGIWANTAWTRFSTGLLFGVGASSLLRQGLAEFIVEAPWRTLVSAQSRLQRGIS